jgi:hypothetical protein
MERGYGLYPSDQEGVYCHGFAWGEGSIEEELKGNLLFMGDVYEKVLKRGMKKNVVGKYPCCGCLWLFVIVLIFMLLMISFFCNTRCSNVWMY